MLHIYQHIIIFAIFLNLDNISYLIGRVKKKVLFAVEQWRANMPYPIKGALELITFVFH